MFRALAAAIVLTLTAPAALAGPEPDIKALKAAMSGLYVIVPTNTETGVAVTEEVTDADGSNPRNVVVAFLDAATAAEQVQAAGIGAHSEGGLINAGDLYETRGGDVTWISSIANASLVNGTPTRPPVFYISNPDDQPLTKVIDGKEKVIFYVDAVAADSARVAAQNTLSAAGHPMDLSVVAGDFEALVQGILDGKVTDVHFAASPSVLRWLEQWNSGARLIKDYQPE